LAVGRFWAYASSGKWNEKRVFTSYLTGNGVSLVSQS
jgi:hypothetical protein